MTRRRNCTYSPMAMTFAKMSGSAGLALAATRQLLLVVFSLFCCNISLAYAGDGSARQNILLESGAKNLSARIDFLVDEQSRFTLDTIQDPALQWQENHRDILDLDFHKNPVWLRLELPFGEVQDKEWYLHFGSGLFRNIEIYFVKNDLLQESYILNDLLHFSEKPYKHPNFVFPFSAQTNDSFQVYARIEHPSHIIMPVTLETDDSLSVSTLNKIFIFGIFVGLVWVLALYNFFVYLSTRDIAYLFYVGYALSMGTYFVSFGSIGFQFFWPHLPHLDAYLSLLPIASVVIFF